MLEVLEFLGVLPPLPTMVHFGVSLGYRTLRHVGRQHIVERWRRKPGPPAWPDDIGNLIMYKQAWRERESVSDFNRGSA